ncbi:MAG: TRAP transporter large permease [Clostridiales Family XIII bacterium]|jgi:tripartite ATP-independent transporter DctM subunit|nr:TRAP transporter large permease [Clostridiales Family XIII bacterium]
MSTITIGIIGLILFLVLLFSGIPVSFAMLFLGIMGLCVLRTPEAAFSMVNDSFTSTFTSYTTTVAPMFILMGVIAGYSGVGASLVETINKFIGHRRGGIAMSVQAVCAIFGAICGSVPATLATIGKIAYPEMKKRNYDDRLSTGAICAGSTLCILIPPSLTFIIYGMVTEESVGKLFISGIVTGVILMVLYMIAVFIWCRISPTISPVSERTAWKYRFKSLLNGGLIQIIIVFIIAMGGLFIGFFTPTEAGAVGVAGIMIVTIITKSLDFKKFAESLRETIRLTVMIYFLLATASVYGKFFSFTRIPYVISDWVVSMNLSVVVIMLMITLIYLILGMLIDAQALILLTIPIFYPVVIEMGLSGLWFGTYIVVVVGMALMTPPVAVATYIMQGLSGVKLQKIFVGVIPFIICDLVMMVLLILFPSIATWLPGLMTR